MGVLRIAFAALIALGVFSATVPSEAWAQMSNQPFSFKFRGASGGAGAAVGMSIAHRQLILERELSNRSTDNPLLRDFSGALLDVQRANDGQAFVRSQSSPYAVGYSAAGFGIGLSGFGYGISGGGGNRVIVDDPFLASPTEIVMATWIASIGSPPGRAVPLSGGGSTIDAWIGQLYAL